MVLVTLGAGSLSAAEQTQITQQNELQQQASEVKNRDQSTTQTKTRTREENPVQAGAVGSEQAQQVQAQNQQRTELKNQNRQKKQTHKGPAGSSGASGQQGNSYGAGSNRMKSGKGRKQP
jgi:hypothetical protein